MKLPIIPISYLLLSSTPSAGGSPLIRKSNTQPQEGVQDRPFVEFLNRDYSSLFGLSLYQTPGTKLYHRVRLSSDALTDILNLPEAQVQNLKEAAKEAGVLWLDDYSKMRINETLHICHPSTHQDQETERAHPGEGSAVLLRVRENFQFLNEDSSAANFLYVDDADSGTATQLAVAAMLDIYPNATYNRFNTKPSTSRPWIIQNKYRFWFRFGMEYDLNDLEPANKADGGSAYGLLNFQINPDQDADFLGIPGLFSITSPQMVQLGVAYDWNNITGEQDYRYIIGWQPRLVLNKDYGIFRQGFALGSRMYFNKGFEKFGQLYNTQKNSGEKSDVYTFLYPYLSLQGPSDVRFGGAEVDFPDLSDNKSLADFRNEVVSYSAKTGFGFFDGGLEFSYTFRGVSPIADLGTSRYWHEAKVEIAPHRFLPEQYRYPKGAPDKPIFTVYASYVYGEPETYREKVDQFRIGGQLRL